MRYLRNARRFSERARTAFGYLTQPLVELFRWLYSSRETTNFTYDLEARNIRHLAAQIADVMEITFDQALGYIHEIEQDRDLKEHIRKVTRSSARADVADAEARFGRRVGWYAIARALKPEVVVETGVDKGLGACALTAALKRNAEEGHPGRYYGTDLDAGAGYLLTGEYARFGSVLLGDSLESLRALDVTIDLFVNDSDHSPEYEAREYQMIAGKLSERAIVLGDNAHCTDALLEFARDSGRHFVFFREKPLRHWYPGAGIGMAFRRRTAR